MTNATFEQVRQLAAEIFEVPENEVTLESSAETIANWDSTQHVSFILALETRFHVEFSPEEMEAVHSIADAVSTIEKRSRSSFG